MIGSDSIQNLHGFAAAAGNFLSCLQGKHFPADGAVDIAVVRSDGFFHRISPISPSAVRSRKEQPRLP